MLELENVFDDPFYRCGNCAPETVVAFLVSKTLGAPFAHEDHCLSPRLFLFI